MEYKCGCGGEQATLPAVSTVDVQQLAHFQSAGQQALVQAFAPARTVLAQANLLSGAAVPQGTTGQLHVTPEGGLLVSTGHASGNEGHVVLTGSIGPLPYELHLTFKLDGMVVTVTMELKKPIPLGPYTWKFRLGGVATGPKGELLSATSVVAEDLSMAAAVAGRGIDWWCALKCGGLGILGILVKCLPALISGGPPGYIACVTASAGGGAAGIAACIAKDCVKV